ncbi:MAG: hypothetical protein ACRD50_13570 [Candidatus Acidiferrales bacterium]
MNSATFGSHRHPNSDVRRILFCRALPLFLVAASFAAPLRAQETFEGFKCPPPTRTDSAVDNYFGASVPDPYRWLEDQNSPETRAWIEAEDRCTAAVLSVVPSRAWIQKRVTELAKVDAFSLPIERHGDYFFSKRGADQDLFFIYMRHGLDGPDEVLIDPLPLSADHSTSVGLRTVSQDASLVAYNVRNGGQDEVTMHFLDVRARKDLPDVLPNGSYFGVDIEPGNKGVYYSLMTKDGPRVFHHVMGAPVASDKEIWGHGYGKEKSSLRHSPKTAAICSSILSTVLAARAPISTSTICVPTKASSPS